MNRDLRMQHATAMNGPEFLQAAALVASADGQDDNALIFQQRGLEWQGDLQTIDTLREQLQAARDQLAASAP